MLKKKKKKSFINKILDAKRLFHATFVKLGVRKLELGEILGLS
jgi:hypothetical protein